MLFLSRAIAKGAWGGGLASMTGLPLCVIPSLGLIPLKPASYVALRVLWPQEAPHSCANS